MIATKIISAKFLKLNFEIPKVTLKLSNFFEDSCHLLQTLRSYETWNSVLLSSNSKLHRNLIKFYLLIVCSFYCCDKIEKNILPI